MIEYLAIQDVDDAEVEVEVPPLIVYFLSHAEPPARLLNPVAAGVGTMTGEWELEHWDTYENIGVYQYCDGGATLMNEQEAAEYLADGRCSF
jgi:hypothetical protein